MLLLAEDNELNARDCCRAVGRVRDECKKSWMERMLLRFFRNHPEGTFDVILMDITDA